MHRKPDGKLSIDDFILPFEGKLSAENHWIKMAEIIPCDEIKYSGFIRLHCYPQSDSKSEPHIIYNVREVNAVGVHPNQSERDEIVKLHFEKGYSTKLLARTTKFSRGAILNWIRTYKKDEGNAFKLKHKRLTKKRSDAQTIKALRAEVEVLRSFIAAFERWDARGYNIALSRS